MLHHRRSPLDHISMLLASFVILQLHEWIQEIPFYCLRAAVRDVLSARRAAGLTMQWLLVINTRYSTFAALSFLAYDHSKLLWFGVSQHL
jgi:hypothetical protein